VVVARLFGAKNWRQMKSAVSTTFLFSGALCAVLMVLGFMFCPTLLHVINTPQEVFADCRLYMNIYIGGLPFLFFYNIATGIFSAMGDSRTPFYFLAASSTANIFVDILFVTTFGMAVDGVAWATFLCQGVSCVLAMFFVLRRIRAIPHEEKPELFSGKLLGEILSIAIPSALQQGMISLGNIILQGIINGYDTGVMAGYSASVKLNNMVITSFTTLGNGISSFVAQNLGAGKKERVRQGFKAGLQMVWMLCIPIVLLYFFFGAPLVRLFIDDPSADALNTGIIYLKILSPFYFVVSMKLVSDGVLRGAGAMKRFMIATFSDMILRVSLAYIFSHLLHLGSVGIWCAWPVGWTTGTLLSLYFFRKGNWNRLDD